FFGLERLFTAFLTEHGTEGKSEFFIPDAVAELIGSGAATVRVLPVEGQWFGTTYREDRDSVMTSLSTLVAAGTYTDPLWA
ncbi:MAG: nucleotidyltransferase, partial [Terrimicrobiaceae bacterium]